MGKSSVPKLTWNSEDEFIWWEIEPGWGEATFLNFLWKATGVLLLCPPWPLSPPCRISGLFLWVSLACFRRTFCVRAAQASQKCRCTTGLEIPWCLSSGSQQMPLFSSRQTQGFIGNLAGLQSGIWIFRNCLKTVNSHSDKAFCVIEKSYVQVCFLHHPKRLRVCPVPTK